MDFEWDPVKASENVAKHQVTFREAATIFFDKLSRTHVDIDHLDQEDRYLQVGRSARGRLLIVAFAVRGERIRIINARQLTRTERKKYEEDPYG